MVSQPRPYAGAGPHASAWVRAQHCLAGGAAWLCGAPHRASAAWPCSEAPAPSERALGPPYGFQEKWGPGEDPVLPS